MFYGCVEQVLRESEGGDICSPDETEPKPLLYYKSSYRSIGDQLFMEAFESGELEFWTHTEHLRMAWTYLRDSGSKELALPLIRYSAFVLHSSSIYSFYVI